MNWEIEEIFKLESQVESIAIMEEISLHIG